MIEKMSAVAEAERAGFDISLIDCSLSYSYQKRAEQHEAALNLALELEKIGQQLRDKSQPTAPATLRRED